jgi:predicted O-methyltransferase YrrM
MDSFLDINKDWFFEKYAIKLSRRYWTFKIALSLLLQNGGKNIVETGCLRLPGDWGGGCSTLVFADFAKKYGLKFTTIDISEENLKVAKEETKDFKDCVEYILSDSLKALAEYKGRIDLLYLDSVDCKIGEDENNSEAQKHQLEEIKLAYPKLTENGIVLLDDNYFKNGGKTRLTKEYLKEKGFVCLMDFVQSLWVRKI